MRIKLFSTFLCFATIVSMTVGKVCAQNNILLIIADDLGVDVLEIDHAANTVEITTEKGTSGVQQVFDLTNISTLLANGVYFTKAWAAPVCSPTRATIYTGLQPWRTGVGWAVSGGNYVLADPLPDGTPLNTIANAISDGTASRTCGLFGKWHLGDDSNFSQTPLGRGWDYYAGNLDGAIGDYESWTKYTPDASGTAYVSGTETTYATQDVVDEAKTWIAAQTGTWFTTLAFNAPHSPFHIPPDAATYDAATITAGDKGKYNAMVQSLDYYIGKLWDPSYGSDINSELSNALIIFVGDNGTPGSVANVTNAKDTVYRGGVHVPMIIADGAKVVDSSASPTFLAASVIGRKQPNQANVSDLYRTIVKRTGATVSSGFGKHSHNLNFYLKDIPHPNPREYNFTQKFTNGGAEHATISNGTYKLNYQNGTWELFDIVTDPTESTNLYGDPAHAAAESELMTEIQKRQKNPTSTTW